MTVDELKQSIVDAAGEIELSQLPVRVTVTCDFVNSDGDNFQESYEADVDDVKFRHGGILLHANLTVDDWA